MGTQLPPSITPRQMNLLRIVLALAWADGNLAKEEADVMLTNFSQVFANTPEAQEAVKQELQGYLVQDIPLEEVVPNITTQAEKEFVLRLGYEVISASARTPDEDLINQDEQATYEKLVDLLGLPSGTVQRIEQSAQIALGQNQAQGSNVVDLLTYQLREHLKG
ncbi:TerB family tellurite resistance protein [Leptolyngbyaceae cyanobacterium CCMR0082]|uniref:TerB family tellurite resistance protein n=2 Tax=Adonisia turfae TaxID=2950184 RepID=A0A6M0SJI1_9CYAN|nr:TerB family tellurite resistance protein [Adonisia turfae]MDV3347957.1 TerB family tellurite resistance protein [Leptothoe sp. LEGE 181152]NEZ58391.1 TerB family tellurite resistance protein [Adonisia turfae CCMR0081]NEZ67692.1 TerB family tellurite resistance protein [Adonisia turfae CCMR0082]